MVSHLAYSDQVRMVHRFLGEQRNGIGDRAAVLAFPTLELEGARFSRGPSAAGHGMEQLLPTDA
jgi:hypothetical protein